MKKLIFALCILLSLGLAACGEEEGTADIGAVYLTVDCMEAVNHLEQMKNPDVVPETGIIFEKTEVPLKEGDSAFDVLSRQLKAEGIHLEHSTTPGSGGVYIEGIGNIYENDCEGAYSGWGYTLNGEIPMEPCSSLLLTDGDEICFTYLVLTDFEMYE